MKQILDRAANIKLLVFDVDGVLTDGCLYVTNAGEEIKTFNSKDGHGMKMLQQSGVPIGIITGRTSNIVSHRMKELGIEHVYQGKKDKLPAFIELLEKTGLQPEQVAYAGDDVVDLPVMSKVGLSITVADGHDFVKQHAHWTTVNRGGQGAAREICELIMRAQNKLDSAFASYLE